MARNASWRLAFTMDKYVIPSVCDFLSSSLPLSSPTRATARTLHGSAVNKIIVDRVTMVAWPAEEPVGRFEVWRRLPYRDLSRS